MRDTLLLFIASTLLSLNALCQIENSYVNSISPALPFLEVESNARTLSLGAVGVVAPEGVSSTSVHANPGLLLSEKGSLRFNLNHTPWARALRPDQGFWSVDASYQWSERHAIGFLAKYYRQFRLTQGDAVFVGYDLALQANYALRLTDHWHAGIAVKGIYSSLPSFGFSEFDLKGQTFAGDLGVSYRRMFKSEGGNRTGINFGAALLDVGPKFRYDQNSPSFIPTRLHIGALGTREVHFDDDRILKVHLGYQLSKYLIPTPPSYAMDENGNLIRDDEGEFVIAQGYDPDPSVALAMIRSFYDAPRGAGEELAEIDHRVSLECSYNFNEDWMLALRGGLFFRDYMKGAKRFLSYGAGVRYKMFNFDVGWLSSPDFLKPSYPSSYSNPLRNTLIFNLGGVFQLGKKEAS